MDVLNNIWSVLTTENEWITKIITAPTVILELWIGFLLFTSILKIEYTPRQKFIHIFVLSISSLITAFFIAEPFNIFINYFTVFIIIKCNLHIKSIKAILAVIIPTVIFALVGNLILNPLLKIFSITSKQLNCIILYRAIYLFYLYLFVYVISILLYKRKISLNILNDLDKNSKHLILVNLVLGTITIAIQLIITFYYINTYSLAFTLLNFISLFAYFFISFYSLTRTMKLQIATKELESAENYNNTLSILYDNVKAFKHDFDNMIFILGGFIDNNDIEGLKKYYINLEKDCERVNNLALLNPTIINNSGIYNLLMAKYKKAADCNVEINLEFFFDFDRLQMPIYEFSRILGILLDNAIEAASSSKEKKVNLIFRDSQHMHTQIIAIKNTYSNKNLDLNKIFEKGVTDKENHSGVGLWEVKQLENRHNNIKLITDADNNYFKQQLEIYY